jgi:2-(1,2-epoxy-1,2-dihydrophenyl)acetyl-CoA isomerase
MSETTPELLTRVEDGVAWITLNRPERRNALTATLRRALAVALTEASDDDAVRCIVLQGAGQGFCAGADVEAMRTQDLKACRTRLQRGAHAMIRALHRVEKPVIASVRGHAAGVGWALALGCDMIVASETARFTALQARRGLAPDGGTAFFLARMVGLMKARELVYTTRPVDAAEALALGLVNRVVPDAALEAETGALARELAGQATFALAMAKQLFQFALAPGLDAFLDHEALIQPQLNQTEDYREGIASFREKRPARFTGR